MMNNPGTLKKTVEKIMKILTDLLRNLSYSKQRKFVKNS